jgi:predicted  nucleic acid-binding Zn-ribbon protein
MTIKKYLKQVAELFNTEKRDCDKEKKCLEEALKKLKAREDSLISKLSEDESEKTQKKLKKELKIISAQLRKGEKIYKTM